MSTPDPTAITVVCWPVAEPTPRTAGSVVDWCHRCRREVTISPASAAVVEAGARVVCVPCATAGVTVLPRTVTEVQAWAQAHGRTVPEGTVPQCLHCVPALAELDVEFEGLTKDALMAAPFWFIRCRACGVISLGASQRVAAASDKVPPGGGRST